MEPQASPLLERWAVGSDVHSLLSSSVSPRKPHRREASFLHQHERWHQGFGCECEWWGQSGHSSEPCQFAGWRRAQSPSRHTFVLVLVWMASGLLFSLGWNWDWCWMPTQLLLIFFSVIKSRVWRGHGLCQMWTVRMETTSASGFVTGAAAAVSKRMFRKDLESAPENSSILLLLLCFSFPG